jgi:hypothetical protein
MSNTWNLDSFQIERESSFEIKRGSPEYKGNIRFRDGKGQSMSLNLLESKAKEILSIILDSSQEAASNAVSSLRMFCEDKEPSAHD